MADTSDPWVAGPGVGSANSSGIWLTPLCLGLVQASSGVLPAPPPWLCPRGPSVSIPKAGSLQGSKLWREALSLSALSISLQACQAVLQPWKRGLTRPRLRTFPSCAPLSPEPALQIPSEISTDHVHLWHLTGLLPTQMLGQAGAYSTSTVPEAELPVLSSGHRYPSPVAEHR